MNSFQVYKDLAERTNGEFYLGVCGPVRTGKSTFIKRFMELLVLPGIADDNRTEIYSEGGCLCKPLWRPAGQGAPD